MPKKKPGFTEPRERAPQPRKIRIPFAALFRMFAIGGFSVIACIWAIWRHYTVPRVPMLEPVPDAAPPSSPSPPGETEVDLEPAR